MKLFKRGKHAYKHTPYKRGKHAQGAITIMPAHTFKYMLQNNQPMLVFGKAGIGATTSVAEFFDGQHQAGPEVLNALYEITHGKGGE